MTFPLARGFLRDTTNISRVFSISTFGNKYVCSILLDIIGPVQYCQVPVLRRIESQNKSPLPTTISDDLSYTESILGEVGSRAVCRFILETSPDVFGTSRIDINAAFASQLEYRQHRNMSKVCKPQSTCQPSATTSCDEVVCLEKLYSYC